MNAGDLSASHLGTTVTVHDFHRQGRVHSITGRLEDVWHLSAGRMTNVVLRDWTADPPLAAWVSLHGGWMVRQEQPVETAAPDPTSTPAGPCAHAGKHLPTGDSQ